MILLPTAEDAQIVAQCLSIEADLNALHISHSDFIDALEFDYLNREAMMALGEGWEIEGSRCQLECPFRSTYDIPGIYVSDEYSSLGGISIAADQNVREIEWAITRMLDRLAQQRADWDGTEVKRSKWVIYDYCNFRRFDPTDLTLTEISEIAKQISGI